MLDLIEFATMNDRDRGWEWALMIAQLQATSTDEDLWTEVRARIAAYVAAMLRKDVSATHADDVVQCALVSLLEALETLDPKNAQVAAYVKQIMRSAVSHYFDTSRSSLPRMPRHPA